MNLRFMSVIIGILILLLSLCSCEDLPSSREVHYVDSLNNVSYKERYTNIVESSNKALQAFNMCSMYSRGKAEAYNNLAFTYFMKMNFEKAEDLYNSVGSISKNEIELLIADIGLMKIYQRTAMNEAFYKKRNDAKKRMRRIDQDSYVNMRPHDVERYNYACSDFYITSAIYYYYLRQREEAVSSINAINSKWLATDSCQWMYYHYLKGSASLCSGSTTDEQELNCFDELYMAWKAASLQKVIYFEANGLQSISDMLAAKNSYQYFVARRGYRLAEMNIPVDSIMPLRMAQRSLDIFSKYQDPYQVAGSLVTIAKYYNIHGLYANAYKVLAKALNLVNQHHQKYYHHKNPSELLLPFAPNDTVNRELRWINSERSKTVPEWLLSIREQLSVTYAGLGNKIASDYNRNAYLDILNYTRQDKLLENRYKALREELHKLNAIFIITLLGTALVILLLWRFNKYAREKDSQHNALLKYLLDECRHITTYSAEEASAKMENLRQINHKNKDDITIRRIQMPYVAWVIDNRKALMQLSEEQDRLDKEKYLSQQHLIENKRQNITKKTCLSIVNSINPYIDRIVNEVHKLRSDQYDNQNDVRKERLQYIDELVTTINDYNDILSQWIKMRQGSISLNIESFELNELFALIKKGRRTFEMKSQNLIIDDTDAIVKADKSLTLFMINTLTENARKYTPEGGSVHVYADSTDKYVEISVEDTGRGLSSDDISKILGKKVYDSSVIGLKDGDNIDSLKKAKGSGFGLMNCKGVIEKYRKTNPLFDVCLFGIESTLGKGSRFFFRIPKGIKRTLIIFCCLFFSFALQSCHHEDEMKEKDVTIDSIAKIEKQPGFELLLNKASRYADLTYFSNVYRHHKQALLYADSAIACLNAHYKKYSKHPKYFMKLVGDGTPAEIEWWNRMYDSDFHIILDVRNEAAVAFLALKELDGYEYNNDVYTSLYKLLGEDKSIGEYCRHLQRSATNKTVELFICFVLIIISFVAYYFFFVRKRLTNRMNMEQVFIINELILKTSLQSCSNTEDDTGEMEKEKFRNIEDRVMSIPKNIVDTIFDAINELVPIERMGMAIFSNMMKEPAFVCNPELIEMPEGINHVYENHRLLSEGNKLFLPLLVDVGDEQNCVGALYLELRRGIDIGTDILLIQLVAEYMAIVVMNSILNVASDYQNIEWVKEDINKSRYEEGLLHVQNMVLDNCLSTIKHETIYYPNKIKQIVTQLINGNDSDMKSENIETIGELTDYYRGVFTILYSCAARQLDEVTFRRSVIDVTELSSYALKYFRKKNRYGDDVTFHVEAIKGEIIGDIILLHFMLENLINESLLYELPGNLILKIKDDGDYIRFEFIDTRRSFSINELNKMFYPKMDRIEYMICRQIIREHDEYAGSRGCRINAEPYTGGGFTIYFTLTKSTVKYGRNKI